VRLLAPAIRGVGSQAAFPSLRQLYRLLAAARHNAVFGSGQGAKITKIGPGKVRLHSVCVGIDCVVIVSTGEFEKLAGAELAWNFAHHSTLLYAHRRHESIVFATSSIC